MYRFIDFNDEKIDSLFVMELSDLTKTLAKNPEFDTEVRVHSYISRTEKKIYVSHFWNHREEDITRAGMKSDVFLRALGNVRYTNFEQVKHYAHWAERSHIPRFAKQLFVLAEDIRIEELCKKARPGMKKEFQVRRNVYYQFFQTQLKANLEKSLFTDCFFNLAYLLINAQTPLYDVPKIHPQFELITPRFQTNLEAIFEAKSTRDIVTICQSIVLLLENEVKRDMINDYFHFHNDQVNDSYNGEEYRDLLRKDPLVNDDEFSEDPKGDEEFLKEEMKTWHRETSEMGKSFLQFDLDQGTKSKFLADDAREGEPGDQSLAIVKGSTGKSSYKDYSDIDEIGEKNKGSAKENEPYGKENQFAEALFLKNEQVDLDQRTTYQKYKNDVILYQKKLKRMIDLTLEHKKQTARSNLPFGRLDKKLVRFFTDEQPRLFYKKDEDSKEIDAVFSMLVDCSASMEEIMEETKKGIILFHEALKSVRVPHEITGFWEDANDATKHSQPNYFRQVVTFGTSLNREVGPEIMHLNAEEDNRDGFAIRVIAERLLTRTEKQKYLIVFSDGEPAAFGYDQNGILDTHLAVVEARKKGIEVINIFLAKDGVGEEQRKVFTNIYGPYSLIAPSIEVLPDILFPLLKKLLFKSIHI